MKEKIKITELFRYEIRDKDTGEVIRAETIEVKEPTFLKRFLNRVMGRESHATILAFGYEELARLLGNVGTSYAVDSLVTNIGSGELTSNSVNVGGVNGATLAVNNSLNPFTTAGTYSWIKTYNSVEGVNYFNSIPCTIVIGTNTEWWAEIEFRFSQG